MGPNSDVDLLVVKPGRFNRRRVTAKIYDQLYGAEAAVDVVNGSHRRIRASGSTGREAIFNALAAA
jgi:hypothetical protein